MFSKQQRSVLSKLSDVIWGSELRWQKLFNDGALNIEESREEVELPADKIHLANSKKTPRGTVYSREVAISKGINVPNTYKTTKVKYRRPFFDELVVNLSEMARLTLYSFMTKEQLLNALAVDLLAGENIKLRLVIKEEQQADYDDLFNRLPEDIRAKLVSEDTGAPVDGLEFVGEVTFALNHHEAAMQVYDANLDAAREAKTKALRKRR